MSSPAFYWPTTLIPMEYLHFVSSHVFPLEEISSNQQEGCVLLGPMDDVAGVPVCAGSI
jgi:hypothetical protein